MADYDETILSFNDMNPIQAGASWSAPVWSNPYSFAEAGLGGGGGGGGEVYYPNGYGYGQSG